MIEHKYMAIFLLNFSHATLIAPIIITGFLAVNRKIFGQVFCLLILSLFINSLLKSYFQIPLSAHLNSSAYAFPSGHMQSSVVLYGWLILNFKHNWFRFLLLLIITGIGFGLIQQNYHNLYDVLGGVFFAMIIIVIAHLFTNKILRKRAPALIGILVLPIIILIKIYLDNINYNFFHYKDLAIWGLGSFVSTWLVLHKQIHNNPSMPNGFSSITYFILISILGILSICYALKIKLSYNSPYISVMICVAMPLACFLSQKLASTKSFKNVRLYKKYLQHILVKLLKANNLN